MAKRTAIVIIHGIGEQVPMATLNSFIDAAWTDDASLVDKGKPDPNTGGERTVNRSWSKPDARSRSFELQLITTESDNEDRRHDFYEYYWAHRVSGTTWEQVRTWLLGLMLRNPFTRVPRSVLPIWIAMWLFLFIFLAISLIAALAASSTPLQPGATAFPPARWTLTLAAHVQALPKALIAAVWGISSLALAALTGKMVDVAGDVVRYVEASPMNIAIRQSIRENGVRLIENLMGIDEQGVLGRTDYDRIIVVGHSLGTIIAYDILTHAFGRNNIRLDDAKLPGFRQEKRIELEAMVREAEADPPRSLDIEAFRALQDACRAELNALGNPWIVSDFISLGSPLTHAEFLLATSKEELEAAKDKRVLPTCPPVLEYDRSTRLKHFTYRSKAVRGEGKANDPDAPRMPHHAALFAYTRWTNIYSRSCAILIGDLVSGRLGDAFGLHRKDGSPLSGIADIAVLPSDDGQAEDRRTRLLTHLRYWDLTYARRDRSDDVPFHIRALRKALDLARRA
jgi:hypothetical protein